MGIKRNEVAEPKWREDDYALIDKDHLFSNELWQRTIHWGTLLTQVRKTELACLLIDHYSYPSRLFYIYLDILEANLYILDDTFYDETGIRFGFAENNTATFQFLYETRFWNLDAYEEVKQFCESLENIRSHLMECLSKNRLLQVAEKVYEKSLYADKHRKIRKAFENDIDTCSFYYAYDAYRESGKDLDALANQIVRILGIVKNYLNVGQCHTPISICALNFEDLTAEFRQSEKGQVFINPWRIEFSGTRDNLISRMEKDPELGPWVNRYTHRREDKDMIQHLFITDLDFFKNGDDLFKNKEELFNTENWIRLLTIAAILQEYDEHQNATDSENNEEEDILLLKLSLYFKDEDTARRFLKSIRQMNSTEITTLVNKYHKASLCTDTSKNLWKVLHDAGLYKPGYTNWNAQVK